ncbi:nuclear envelope phosphatase-regulatory subunit 1 homolog isoform X1 [Penaeus chinensis]|uniref:nuclear envelope phosphatase-regulatory subunit 1 homolog isoform X1 n=1 Tax=Penaeus chinensis TaxID=139456 RepID=UPI001FB809D4|nr:nuclear envelope phosphatase-regulatory subunit 1 homolog isoform X1 [Penaeus chinensis]XP_047474592.1 nuclear envelope phosphatase-regulatory subunit 1 homolog isoform X1 [Penaeus chinensis]
MSLEQTACEDLKAFERRLTEVINRLQPATVRWRMTTLNRTCISVVLTVAALSTAFGAYLWFSDPIIHSATVPRSLINRLFFTVAVFSLVLLFIVGIHKKVVFPSIITSRTRIVLSDFNMSCDDTGKLILKPRPTST